MADELSIYPKKQEAWYPTFSPDDERLAFVANLTGEKQVWTTTGGGWPEQLTFFDGGVSFGSWSPLRDELAFGMDAEGDERTQLYLLDDETWDVTRLTDDPDAMFRWGGWSNDGEEFAYAANARHPAIFDLHVQGRTETAADDPDTLVCEGEVGLAVSGWSPSDDRLALTKSNSNYDQDVYVFDRKSGDLEHVTPHDGSVRFSSANWAPSGDALYLLTDADADTLYVARLDLATGDLTPVVRGGEWNVQGMNFHAETGRLLYGRNVEGYIEVSVVEVEEGEVTREFPAPDIPDGIVGTTSFTTDGSRVAVPVTNRTLAPNIFVFDVATGEAEQVTHASVAGVPDDALVEPELVRYESFDDREIPAFFSVPNANASADADADAEESEVPVVVDVHGGPESQRTAAFNEVAQNFLKEGYAVFEPNVRGSLGYGKEYASLDDERNRLDAVADVKSGVEWLADRPEVDEDRIVAFGSSYGGFVVLSCLTRFPDRWAAGVDICGISNFVTFLENTGEWRRELREAEYGSLDEDREFLESISPLNDVDRIDAPLFVVHGENDPRVPIEETEQLLAEASEQGVETEKLFFEDEGHGISTQENRVEAYREILDFLEDVLESSD